MNTTKYNTLIENLALDSIPFAQDILKELDTTKISTVDETRIGSVDLSKIIGTCHPDYVGLSWGELKPIKGTSGGDFSDYKLRYQSLKRAYDLVKELDRNPEYYLNTKFKHHWSFYEIEGQYYISSGNNRTVISRYFFFLNNLPQIVHGVEITPIQFKNESVPITKPKKRLPYLIGLKSK